MGQAAAGSGRVGRRRLLGLGLATGVGLAGSLVPSLDRTSTELVNGITGADVVPRLQAAVDAYLAAAQSFVLEDRRWEISRQALGLSLTIVAVPAAGPLPVGPPSVHLDATVEPVALEQALATLPGVQRSPVDAQVVLAGVDAMTVADQPGQRLDATALAATLREHAAALSDAPVPLPVVSVPADTATADLAPIVEWLDRVLSRPLTFAETPGPVTIPPAALASALRVTPDGEVTPDWSRWEGLVAPLVAVAAVAPVEPTVRLANGAVELIAPRAGQTLDVRATIDAAWTAVKAGQATVLPVLKPVPPQRTAADVTPIVAQTSRLLLRPPVLVAGEVSRPLTAGDLERLVRVTPTLSIDSPAAEAVLAELAARVDIAPRLPSFRLRDGQAVAVDGSGKPGRRLDRDAALTALARGLTRGEARIVLPVVAAEPVLSAAELTFPHVLAEGRTFFGDSARERYANVALGLARIDGVLVPPGAPFSFNQASGPVTYATGFQRGYGIAISNGKVTTLPSVGGGICQVATTVFHAAFRAGLPIVERSWHLYWMPRYGRPPSGVTGLDATVDDQSNLDFGFVNATDHWLWVEAIAEDGNAVVRLHGVDPGWKVTIDGPVITNVVRASQTMTERRDPSLPRGARLWVEHAEDGKTVSITRTVLNSAGERRERRAFISHYAPAANVTLVGTGGRVTSD